MSSPVVGLEEELAKTSFGHAVTPLGGGDRRVTLTLHSVTNQRMGSVKKLFSHMKDAFACFGPAALMCRPMAK